METKSYFFTIDKKFFKQGYVLTDSNKEVVYEAKMTKFTLFTAFKFDFINHITTKTVEHKVGHTVTLQESTNGYENIFATKSSFKFDGKKIWYYLHELGVRIDSKISNKKIGMTYSVSLKGNEIATLSTSSPNGKFFLTSKFNYDIKTTEENLDIAFLCAFAFARTEQAFYD